MKITSTFVYLLTKIARIDVFALVFLFESNLFYPSNTQNTIQYEQLHTFEKSCKQKWTSFLSNR